MPDRCTTSIACDMSSMLRNGTDMKGIGMNWSDRGSDNTTIRILQPERRKLLFRSNVLLIANSWLQLQLHFT